MMQKRILFLAAMLLTLSLTVMAQITTSGINGKVVLGGPQGEEAIGATVVAVHQTSGTRYTAVTNIDGRYTIQGMRAGGPYTVTFSYIGSQTKSFENIMLQLGESYSLQVWLVDDTKQLGEVVISGQAGLAASRTGAAETIGGQRINELPSLTHSVADIARTNPFVKVTEGGAISIAGTSNRYNVIQIDGAMANDVFGLTNNGANGGMAGTQPFAMETIDQLQVSIAPFDVRQSGFTGGAINAITKSGTNDFHGSVYSYFQNGSMVSDKYRLHNGKDSEDYGSLTDYTIGATVGGPILKDKLFFFANYEHTDKEYDNAYSSDNGMSKVDFSVASSILNDVKAKAATQGVNYGASLGTPKEYTYSDKAGVKLDWNINDRHHAVLRWSMVKARQNNKTSTASTLCTDNYAYEYVSKTHSLVMELQSKLNDNMSNEFHATWTSVSDDRNPGAVFPYIEVSNVGGGTLSIGNERSAMANGLDQDIFTLTDNFTWTIGMHTLTAGTHDELYKFGNLYCPDIYGSYYYSSPADYFAGNLKRYRYGQAVESVTGTPRWVAKFGAAQLGFYVQDKWVLTDRLNLTYGLRIDMPIMLDTPTENATFNTWAANNGYNIKNNQKISVKPMWSPRVGFRYDVLDRHRLILRGGIGIFTGRVPYVWLSNSFSNTGIQQLAYDTNLDKSNLGNIKLYLNPNDFNKNLPASQTGSLSFNSQKINVFKKDFKYAQQLRADMAVDFTDPWGIKWSVEGIYAKTLNDMIIKKLNIEETGKTWADVYGLSFDSRPMFQTMKGTANIYLLDNVSKGYSYNIAVKADKKFDFGLELSASYTYSQSKTINNGVSSAADSNWEGNYTHGKPNTPELAYSSYNMPHEIILSAYQHIKWNKQMEGTFDNQTTIGLIYIGRSGAPYNFFVYGDVNGDGGYNDLMFIPTDAQIDEMLAKGLFKANKSYTAAQQADNFKAWLAKEDYLKDHRGEYFERNGANEDFEHRLDLHLDHKFGMKIGKDIRYIQLGFDIINFTNMLNKKWGATMSQMGPNNYYPLTYDDKSGQYQFLHAGNYDVRAYSDYYSRWRMQFSAKLTF